MGFFRSVNRKSYQKMIFSQKAAPFLIQKRAVGLEGIMYLYSSAVVLILKFYRFSEKVQPPQRRLSPLIGIINLPLCMDHGSSNHIFQCFLRHKTIGFLLSFLHLIAVKTVIAMHITQA